MGTKQALTQCTVRNDPRLIAGVGAVVSHAAEHAGLVEVASNEFAAATEEACREAMASLNGSGGEATIELAVAQCPGRVEITIQPAVNGHTAHGLQGRTAVHAMQGVCQKLERKGVDRVLCENSPHTFRMKLIKYCVGPKVAGA
jgi:hypothetical protein